MAVLYLLAASAMAAPCTEAGSRGPIDITVPDIKVGRDVPVGAVLAEVTSHQSSYWLECSTPNNIRYVTLANRLRGNLMEVLGADGRPIPGLGVRLKSSNDLIRGSGGRCVGANVILSARNQFVCRVFVTIDGLEQGGGFGLGLLTLTFVKTSPELATARLAQQTVLTVRMDSYSPISYRINGGGIVANPCTFDIPGNVSLGSMSAAAMNEGKSGTPALFQMRVNCADSARYRLKFTPTGGSRPVGALPGALSNSAPAGLAAKHVSVQIEDVNGAPVKLDTDIDHGTQQAMSAVTYRARMVRDGAGKVEAGAVAAAMEVNFTFY